MLEESNDGFRLQLQRHRPAAGLYICATPIGNLEDVSLRLLRVLATADRIACEDTRHTGRLLSHFKLSGSLVSYHEHNERERAEELLAELAQGRVVALVSDAGMPAIADPGYRLVRRARDRELPVWVVPGPSAVTAALAVSGLATHRFAFYGFVPRRRGERKDLWAELALARGSSVLYESPHRLLATLAELAEALGPRPMVVCRELTKRHEETRQGTAHQLRLHFQAHRPRGELTLVIAPAAEAGAGAQQGQDEDLPLAAEVELLMESGLERMEAIRRVARGHGLPRQAVYRRVARQR